VPSGPEWFHEIKHDGYRLRVEREGDHVRLITRGGYDWTKRFPWIVEAALKNRQEQFVIDGEAVILCLDGMPDFNALHSGKHNAEVQFCAFNVLAIDGEDLRPPALDAQNQPRAAASRPSGWHLHQSIRERRDRAGSLPNRTRRDPEGSNHDGMSGRTDTVN
jgi:bifunctional non-homologous end joining protein LigD